MSTTGGPAPPPNLESDTSRAIQAQCRIRPSPQSPALQDETGTKLRPYAAGIVLSSSGADAKFEWLDDLKCLSSKEDLKYLGKIRKIYILVSVDKEFMAVADKITEETTRGRVERDLSKNKSVTLEIKDLYKLDGFLGWSWIDIQKILEKIKKKPKFILYVKKNGQLVKAIKDLHLDHVYLLGEAEMLLGQQRSATGAAEEMRKARKGMNGRPPTLIYIITV